MRYFNIRNATFETSPLVNERESVLAGMAVAWIITSRRAMDR